MRGSRPDFFEPLDLGRELANLGVELGQFLVVGLGLLFARLRFGEEMGEVVQRLTLPPVQLPGMNLVLGGDLGDRLLFFQHFEHHVGFERRGMMVLLWHNVSRVTLEALQTCLVFGDHYKLTDDPRHPGLRTHRVRATQSVCEASANMDLRITWQYSGSDVMVVRNCGHHDRTLKNP